MLRLFPAGQLFDVNHKVVERMAENENDKYHIGRIGDVVWNF